MVFSKKLAHLLIDLDMEPKTLAKAVGVTTATISRWQDGKRAPSLVHGLRLARALGVSLVWLADDAAPYADYERKRGDIDHEATAALEVRRIGDGPNRQERAG